MAILSKSPSLLRAALVVLLSCADGQPNFDIELGGLHNLLPSEGFPLPLDPTDPDPTPRPSNPPTPNPSAAPVPAPTTLPEPRFIATDEPSPRPSPQPSPRPSPKPVPIIKKVLKSDADSDQFTYQDRGSSSPNDIYPPNQWNRVRCRNQGECMGWPDPFVAKQGWTMDGNDCEWCPATGNSCGNHHGSPINLDRNVAIEGSPDFNFCKDTHFSQWHDSSCTWEDLEQYNAFSIERHSLRVVQPLEKYGNGYRIACGNHLWPVIDYAKGYSSWFYLSHMDIHAPSEHHQNGRQYSAEIQLYHTFSVSGREAGVDNELAAVTVFLQEYDDAPDNMILNKLLCKWRQVEEENRRQCGLPSVTAQYDGCTVYNRPGRKLKQTNVTVPPKPLSLFNVIRDLDPNDHEHVMNVTRSLNQPLPPEQEVTDWARFYRTLFRATETSATNPGTDYSNVQGWNAYWPILHSKTEYYFRYSGTMTVPPCYGLLSDSQRSLKQRGNLIAWRVMKDPIQVSTRQILEIHRLLKDRIAPADDPLRACRPDTAAKTDSNDSRYISTARPLQSTETTHYTVYCECVWPSNHPEDNEWCDLDRNSRFSTHPYNYDNRGF